MLKLLSNSNLIDTMTIKIVKKLSINSVGIIKLNLRLYAVNKEIKESTISNIKKTTVFLKGMDSDSIIYLLIINKN